MKIRAVIFDIYGTLFQIGPAPANASEQWVKLHEEFFQTAPALTWLSFNVACNRAIATRHGNAHGRGILKPEISWPSVVAEVLPAFTKLDAPARTEFIHRQIQLGRTIKLVPGMAGVLRWLAGKKCLLGIASNAQAYTLRELEGLLKIEGLKPDIFHPEVRFFSYWHGFSKPDPHVFQVIRMRLEAHGIRPAETLVVGDRLDNDIEPARVQGFHIWHLKTPSPEKQSGGADKLHEYLVRSV